MKESKEQPLKVIAGAPDRPLVIGNIEIPCYVLEDETRVLSQRGVSEGIGLNPKAGFRMPHFMASKAINPFVSDDLVPALKSPIPFKNPVGGGNAYGYPATILPKICAAVIEAKNKGKLRPQHMKAAERCWIIMQGFAHVGIIALVDEATGYQDLRDRQILQKILDKYLLAERAKWAKRFPDDFYKEIFRLRGWQWQGMRVNRPQVVAHYTNDIVWDRLAPGVREELEKLNPQTPQGTRRARHHQWLTHDIGHPSLQKHLYGVIALMKSVVQSKGGWGEFKRRIQRVFPKIHTTLDLPFNEDG